MTIGHLIRLPDIFEFVDNLDIVEELFKLSVSSQSSSISASSIDSSSFSLWGSQMKKTNEKLVQKFYLNNGYILNKGLS